MSSYGLGIFLTVMAPRDRRASFVRALRVVRRIDQTHGFLVACRAAGAIAWYARAKAILRAHRPEAVVVSSDTNPEEVGFTAAARALGIPTIFISHAYPTPFSPPLAFDLSILGGRRKLTPAGGEGRSAARSCSQDWKGNRHHLTRHSSTAGSRSLASLRRKV